MREGSGDLVSVIIPCYNQARFLAQAIDSVLGQTHADYEIIVVDDGSPDNVPDITASYPLVRYVRQGNQGLGAARNTGIRESKGSCLVFLDADDRLLPHALETGLKCLKAHPDCAFVAGRCNWVTLDGSILPSPAQPTVESDHYRQLLIDNCRIYTMTAMFRRWVFDVVGGYDTSLAAAEDWDLNLRIGRRFPICLHSDVVGEYLRHEGGISRNAEVMLKSILKVLRSQRRYIRGHRQYKEAYQEGIREMQKYLGERIAGEVRALRRAGEWRRAGRGMLVLLRLDPRGFARRVGRKLYRAAFRVGRRG